jgi:hypothetical protein
MEDSEMRAIRKIRTLLLALLIAVVPALSSAGVFVSITVAPPVLPVYTQPVCPGEGYLWTPGYWAYGPDGYYWVPGVWVLAPQPGLLWTPGYWEFADGFYAWHPGYWGPHVGYYGGVNYGYGYYGDGFYGGRWEGGYFAYNSAVLHVNRTIVHNTYIDRTVFRNTTVINRTSFNGPGGINTHATREEIAVQRERHFGPTPEQASHEHTASFNRVNFASVNGGRPVIPAMSRISANNLQNHVGNNFNNQPVNNNRGQNRNQFNQLRPQQQNNAFQQHAPPANVSPVQRPPQNNTFQQHAPPAPVQRPQQQNNAFQQHAPPANVSPVQRPPQNNTFQQHAPPAPVQRPQQQNNAFQQHAPPANVSPVQRPPQNNAQPAGNQHAVGAQHEHR